ncbi:MAG: DUF2141 domain-containing protein [Rikenellaceae bacterium]
MKHILTLFFLIIFSFSLNAQTKGDITVRIEGMTSPQGTMMIFVSRNESEFKEHSTTKLSFKVPAKMPITTTVLNLPLGKYAVSVYHDENNNGKIDKNIIGIPKEKYGISNNKYSKIGAQPPFSVAAVEVTKEPKTIQIKLRKF